MNADGETLEQNTLRAYAGHGLRVLSMPRCQACNHYQVVRNGHRKTKHKIIQTFLCRSCGVRYSHPYSVIENGHHDAIVMARVLAFKDEGITVREAQSRLRKLGIQVSHQTVWRWWHDFSSGTKRTRLILRAVRQMKDAHRMAPRDTELSEVSRMLSKLANDLSQHERRLRLRKPPVPGGNA